LTEGISNVAVVALLLPLGISVAGSFGIDPRVMAMVVAVPSGLAYMLPMGTPPNAIAFSSGFIGIKDMVKIGFILNFLSLAVFVIMARIYWPFLGLNF
jgi:solute carrier family 13 (sodium-dependent dicarboxylate transporter), member 2/3/5